MFFTRTSICLSGAGDVEPGGEGAPPAGGVCDRGLFPALPLLGTRPASPPLSSPVLAGVFGLASAIVIV